MNSRRKLELKSKKRNKHSHRMLKALNKKKKKQRFIPFIWLSLILHSIFLLLIIIFAFKKIKIFKIINIQDIKSKKNEMPASLKPRKSEFGTTVFFDPTPQFEVPKTEMLAKENIEKKTQKIIEKSPQIQKKEAIKEKPELIKKEIQKPIQLAEKKLESTKIQQKIKEIDDKEIKKKIKEIEKKQKQIEASQKAEKLRTLGKKEKSKSPITKPKKSIIALTKGYIENLKDKGSDWLERKGDDNKKLNFEELKYISYEEKINWHLQSSWKQLLAHSQPQRIMEGKAVIEFKIDENGNVFDLFLLQSSGNNQLDQIILKSVKLATPFPPLPKHFNTKIYSTGRIIYVNSRRLRF